MERITFTNGKGQKSFLHDCQNCKELIPVSKFFSAETKTIKAMKHAWFSYL
jgi:hypothetical protein